MTLGSHQQPASQRMDVPCKAAKTRALVEMFWGSSIRWREGGWPMLCLSWRISAEAILFHVQLGVAPAQPSLEPEASTPVPSFRNRTLLLFAHGPWPQMFSAGLPIRIPKAQRFIKTRTAHLRTSTCRNTAYTAARMALLREASMGPKLGEICAPKMYPAITSSNQFAKCPY